MTFLRSLFGAGAGAPSIRVPCPPMRAQSLEPGGGVANAIQQVEALDGPTRVRVVIQITFDDPNPPPQVSELPGLRIKLPTGRRWHDHTSYEVPWRPASEGGVQLPPADEVNRMLEDVARRAGAKAARMITQVAVRTQRRR